MPEKDIRPSSSTTTASPVQSTPNNSALADQDLMGNAAMQEQLQNSQQSGSPGTFESMWKEISSEGAITDYAVDAVDSALSGMRQWIREQAEPEQGATAALFVRALQGEINRTTRTLMNDYGLSKWIAQHPELIVAVPLHLPLHTSSTTSAFQSSKEPWNSARAQHQRGHRCWTNIGNRLNTCLWATRTQATPSMPPQLSARFSIGYVEVSTRLESDLVQMGLVTFDELRAYVRGSYESTGMGRSGRNRSPEGDLSYGVESYANDDGSRQWRKSHPQVQL